MRLFSVFLFFFISCTANIKKISKDEQIQLALNEIKKTNYSHLVSYIYKSPVDVEYNLNLHHQCFHLKTIDRDKILIPYKSMSSQFLTEIETLKGMYIYKIKNKFELKEYPYEVDLLLSYLEIDYIIRNNKLEYLKDNSMKNELIYKKFCKYIISIEEFESFIKELTQKNDIFCHYPLYDINYYEERYKNLKEALVSIEGDSFFKLMYEIYLDEVKKGEITLADAQKKYYYLLSEPRKKLQREQMVNIVNQLKFLSKFKRFYNSEIKKFYKNREKYKDIFENFLECKP